MTDISNLLQWGPPNRVFTKRGERTLRKAAPTDLFWSLWQTRRSELSAAGVVPGKKFKGGADEWEVCWWQDISLAEQQAREQAREASKAVDAAVEIPAPDGLAYLGYQKAGIHFALQRPGTLIADEMGLGKTIQAIGVINADPKIAKALIICPASLKINWHRELRKWLVRPLTVGIVEPDCWPTTDIAIVNFDIIHKFEKRANFWWDLLVIDEAHYLKSQSARRTKHILGYRPRKKELEAAAAPGATKAQKEAGLSRTPIPARRKLFMTGTPIVNRPNEIFPLINNLCPTEFPEFFRFAKRYCAAVDNGFGWDFTGASNLAELQDRLRQTCMVRRLKKDVLTELPPKVRSVIELPSEGLEAVSKEAQAARAHEDKMVKLKVAMELAKAEGEDAYKAAVAAMRDGMTASFTELAKLRHDTAVAKLPLVIEAINEELEQVPKLLVFAHHRDVLEGIRDAFPHSALVYGGMDGMDKMREVDRFQNRPECRVFVGQFDAAGVGLTLTAASLVCFAEEDWVPGKISQCEDRAHRIGQKDCVMVKHLVLAGSLDVEIARQNVAKQVVIDAALDKVREEMAAEPIVPFIKGPPAVSATREQIAKAAATITPAQIAAVHQALKILAGVCDGAARIDGAGFSKVDSGIGHSLASQLFITPKQAALGARLVRKYQRQLGRETAEACGVL
jgi:SWI/SNF-related matrix-associated actin-dependent regulator 1 of chromatin subfamily A